MNKASILILSVLALAGAGAFFLMNGDDDADALLQGETAWLATVSEDELVKPKPVDLRGAEDAEADSDESDEEVLVGLEALDREKIESDEPSGNPLVVQVWDRQKGVPAIEADVYFLDSIDGKLLEDPFAQHWSDHAQTEGQRFKTDANGRVELPPVQDRAMVTAQASGSYGFTRVRRKHRAVEMITLQADETVTVRVIDGEGRPAAGVPVGVVQRIPVRERRQRWDQLMAKMNELQKQADRVDAWMRDNPAKREQAAPRIRAIREQQGQIKREMGRVKGDASGQGRGAKGQGGKGRSGNGRGGNERGKKPQLQNRQAKPAPRITERTELRSKRRTDEMGVAVFRHFQVYRRQNEKWWPRQNVDQFEAVLLMPLQQPVSRRFDGRPVPTETLELELPPTGSVALRFVDHEGRPFMHPVRADLRMEGESVPWARMRKRKEQNEELIEFPFIGLGLQLTAQCRLDDDDFRWGVPPFAGPSNAGERVTIDVVVAPKAGMLFGRLIDASGTPLASLRPSFLINTSTGRLEGEDVITDTEGRFHLPYQVRANLRPPYRLEIRRREGRPTVGLAMPLQTLAAGQVTDLGDLQLGAFGKIVYGAVVNDQNQPIARANVQLQRERNVGRDRPRMAFVDEAFVTCRTDEEGRYELFGELEPGRYRLRVQARNHFPLETESLSATAPTDLQMLRISKVIGTVRTPEWMKSKRLRIVLESAVDTKQRREDRVHDHKGKKYIYFDRVRAGIYNVAIRVEDFPDPVLRIDGLEIAPGQQDVHPRLQDIDLGAFLYRFVVTAVDERGQKINPGAPLVARITRPGGRTVFVGFPFKGRTIEIISASPELEVFPMANGYRAERTVLGPGESQVQFLRLPPLELQLPGMRQLVGEALVWIKLQSIAPAAGGTPEQLEMWDGRSNRIGRWYGGMKQRENGRILGDDDTVSISTTTDGKYKVIAYLLGTTKRRKAGTVPVELGVVDVRIVPGSGPQRLVVNFDAKAVQKGMTELQQREAQAGGGKGR